MINNIMPYIKENDYILNERFYFNLSEEEENKYKQLAYLSNILNRNKFAAMIASPIYMLPIPILATLLTIPFLVLGHKLDKNNDINKATIAGLSAELSKNKIKEIQKRIKGNKTHKEFFENYTDYIISLYDLKKISSDDDLLPLFQEISNYLSKHILTREELQSIKNVTQNDEIRRKLRIQ